MSGRRKGLQTRTAAGAQSRDAGVARFPPSNSASRDINGGSEVPKATYSCSRASPVPTGCGFAGEENYTN